jgi:hypothetical protein
MPEPHTLPPLGWQHEALAELRTWAAHEPEILGLTTHGSAAGSEEPDEYSDLDVTITSTDPLGCAARLTDVMTARFTPVFASASSTRKDGITLRLVLKDLRRIDATITLSHPEPSHAVTAPVQDGSLRREFDTLINDFLFEAVLAAVKAGRGDLLIAAHLTYGLARHILTGAMLMRDRDTGTRHHRHGGTGHDRWAAALGPAPAITDAATAARVIRCYTGVFAELAAAVGFEHPLDTRPLHTLLDMLDPST